MNIESPTKKAVDADAAAAKGLVLVHATTTEGKCVVAKLEVSTGKGLTLSLTNGVLTFTNAYASLAYDYWGEPMGYSFTDFAVGIVPASEFVDDPAGYIASLANWEVEHAGENGYMYNNWNLEFTQFEEGVYEVDVIEYAVKDFCAWLMWDTELYPDHDVEVGVPYVIWATPVNDRGEADPSQVEYVTYTKILSEGEVSEITHNDALLSLELMGADKYFVGLVSQAELATYGVDLEAYMANSAPWGYMTQGYVDWIENFYEDGAHEVAMSVLNGYYEPVKLQPGTKYYYWVVPHTVGTVYNDYATQFAPYVKEFATADLTVGDVALSVEKTVEAYYNLAATVTVADSTTVYYNFYTSEEWAEFDEDDDAILSALLGMTNYNDPLTETTVVEETCEPGQTVICAAVAVSDAGVRSAIATASFQAPVIAKNQATMSLKSLMTTATGYKAVVNVEGAAKVCGYNISDTSRDYYVKFLTKEVAKNSANTACQWVDVVDGTATIEFPLNTYKKDYYVMAYNADADGNLVDLSDVFVFNIAENVFQFDVAKVEIGGGTLLNLAAPWSEIEAGSKNYDIYVKMNTAAGVEWTVTATKNGEAYTDPNSPMLSKTYAGDAQSDHMWVPLNITNDPIEWALTVTTTYAGEEVSKTVQFTQKGAPIVENDTFEITRAFNGGVGNLNLTEPWSEIPATFVTNMADGTTDFYVVVDATKTWTVSVTKDGEPYSHSGGVFGKEYAGSHQSDHIWITPNTTDKPVQWAITVTALVNGEQVAKTIEFTQKAAN